MIGKDHTFGHSLVNFQRLLKKRKKITLFDTKAPIEFFAHEQDDFYRENHINNNNNNNNNEAMSYNEGSSAMADCSSCTFFGIKSLISFLSVS